MPVYGFCDAHCKHEVYTTDEVLSILQQAIDAGSLQGIDPDESPVVALIRESRANVDVSLWVGTEAQYNAIVPSVSASLVMGRIDANGKIYFCTNDSTLQDWHDQIIIDAQTAANTVVDSKANKTSGLHEGKIAKILSDGGYTSAEKTVDELMEKVDGATSGNVPLLDSAGALTDSGVSLQNILATFESAQVALTVSGWTDGSQTVSVEGMAADDVIIVSPDDSDFQNYSEAGVYCSAQAAGSLTFTALYSTPTEEITVNVVNIGTEFNFSEVQSLITSANTAIQKVQQVSESWLKGSKSGKSISANDSAALLEPIKWTMYGVMSPAGATAGAKVYSGNAIVWNQLIKQDTPNSRTISGVTFTNNSNGTWTLSGTASGSNSNIILYARANIVTGHKYLIRGCPSGGSNNTYYFGDSTGNGDFGEGYIFDGVYNAQNIALRVNDGTTVNNVVFTPQMFDLTKIFGEGNEPETVAEFRALYPNNYYPYNSGTEQDHAEITVKKSGADVTLNAVEVVADSPRTPNVVIDGKNYIADTVTDGGSITRRVISVDAESISWVQDTGASVFHIQMNDAPIGAASYLDGYTSVANGSTLIADLSCGFNLEQNVFYARDDRYTTAADFKAAMDGKILYYELATPTTDTATIVNQSNVAPSMTWKSEAFAEIKYNRDLTKWAESIETALNE